MSFDQVSRCTECNANKNWLFSIHLFEKIWDFFPTSSKKFTTFIVLLNFFVIEIPCHRKLYRSNKRFIALSTPAYFQ